MRKLSRSAFDAWLKKQPITAVYGHSDGRFGRICTCPLATFLGDGAAVSQGNYRVHPLAAEERKLPRWAARFVMIFDEATGCGCGDTLDARVALRKAVKS